MTLKMKSDVKFKEKVTCGFKNVVRNLVNLYPTIQKFEIWRLSSALVKTFCPKCRRFELQS